MTTLATVLIKEVKKQKRNECGIRYDIRLLHFEYPYDLSQAV